MRITKGCAAALGLLFLAITPCAAGDWDVLTECRFVEGEHSDGDSIEVDIAGKHHVFRLYFVDTIEQNSQSKARRAGQGKYFGLTGDQAEGRALQCAYAASEFTKKALAKPFTVRTRWEPVDSGNGNPSVRAFVQTADGRDLGEALVGAGLAIIRNGAKATSDHPGGRSADDILRALRETETNARLEGRGAWQFTLFPQKPDPLPDETIDATDRDRLLARAGHATRVHGRISRIGALPDGRITFLNFEGTRRGDFVVIIRSAALPAVLERFPEGLDKSLVGRAVEIEGLVTLFQETPQIEVDRPGQISLLDEATGR